MANTRHVQNTITILGAGSWGTALAIVLARNGCQVNLWGRFSSGSAQTLQETHINARYLPGITLPENIQIIPDLAEAISNVSTILSVVPSHVFREVLEEIKPLMGDREIRLAWATKGFDVNGKLLHESVCEILGDIPMAVLSGPTFALEVAKGLPTAVTVASHEADFAQELASYLHSETFRVYTSSDLIGVQVGGAVKNVVAIAMGIADGMGLGANARCALITRGLAELTRLGIALGGQMDTFMGLSGLGDLVLTCTDDQSRNRRFGLAVGKGYDRESAEKNIGQVVEGIVTAQRVYYLVHKTGVEMPISEQVYRILYENLSPQQAVTTLLKREQKREGG